MDRHDVSADGIGDSGCRSFVAGYKIGMRIGFEQAYLFIKQTDAETSWEEVGRFIKERGI